jgi:UDP-glucose 4-epimerase
MVLEIKPKVLVTGGAGFIGSHIVDLLIANGYEVVVVDNLSSGIVENVNLRATFYKADIRDPDISKIFEKEKPEYISHHAAQRVDCDSTEKVVQDADVNILGTLNLLETARRYNIKLFIFASDGQDLYGEPLYLPCDETHPVQPTSLGGIYKQTIEQYLNQYHQMFEMNYIVLRYPNVYGPRQSSIEGKGLIPSLITKMLSGVQMVISQQNDQREDYVYVTDCARATLLCLECGIDSGIYNLGSGHSTPINTIITILKELINYPYTPVMPFVIDGKTREIYLDTRKVIRHLGWQPQVDLLEGLESTLAFTKQMMKLV